MKPLTAEATYQLGRLLEYLRRAERYDLVIYEDGAYEKYGQKLIFGSMNELAYLLGQYELAQPELSTLRSLAREFGSKYSKEKRNLDDADRANLVVIIERIEAAVAQEISRRNFAELTPVEGILNYNRLLSEGIRYILGETAQTLPSIVSRDLNEAIKCLSYGAPTASVMIGLRAVEGMLKQVHCILTGDATKKTWKQLLEGIQQDLRNRGVEESPLFGYLNYVRDVRNQADHPDRTFTLLEAEQLFMHAIHIIREVEKLGGTADTSA